MVVALRPPLERGPGDPENLTEFAFGSARKAPEAFKAGLAARIRELQK